MERWFQGRMYAFGVQYDIVEGVFEGGRSGEVEMLLGFYWMLGDGEIGEIFGKESLSFDRR